MMSIDAALTGVTVLGLDTAPFIYFIERNPVYLDRVRAMFRRIHVGELFGHTSVITLTEVLVHPLRYGHTALAQRYRRFLTRSRNLVLDGISISIAEEAARLRARYDLRTPDTVQLASAIQAGCTAFLTNDRRFTRVSEIRILVLDDLQLDPAIP